MDKPNGGGRIVRVFRLGDEPGDDLSASTTPAERVEMVVILTRRMVELGAIQPVAYARSHMPIRVIRPA
jgi:hypothetical protein